MEVEQKVRSYDELQRERDGGVQCKGTLQWNKYLCSRCRRRQHSPCSLFQSRTNVPLLWNNTRDGGMPNRSST